MRTILNKEFRLPDGAHGAVTGELDFGGLSLDANDKIITDE